VNPATVVYFAALVVGNRDVSTLSRQHGIVFAAAAGYATASWQRTLAATGRQSAGCSPGPRGRLGTALVSGCVILALAIDVAVQ
jgi:arginine exporter protein ArgO